MTYYFRNPDNFAEARRRMWNRMMNGTFDSDRVRSFPIEMKSSETEYELRALLPGLTAEQVNIQFNDGTLTIDGEYKAHEEDSSNFISEFPAGKFSRSIDIKEPVVIEKIEANMKDGILTIRLPKAEESKPKSIKINAR